MSLVVAAGRLVHCGISPSSASSLPVDEVCLPGVDMTLAVAEALNPNKPIKNSCERD